MNTLEPPTTLVRSTTIQFTSMASSPIAIASSPLRALRRLSLGRSPVSAAPSWEDAGLTCLAPGMKLLELGELPFGSPAAGSWSSEVDMGRQIPRATSFVIEWTGDLPATATFEITALGPALLQAGDYVLTLAWRAENGSMQDIAAAKSVSLTMGKRIIADTESNLLAFSKPDGSAAISVVKERWLQSTRKERAQVYRCILVYQPPRQLLESPMDSSVPIEPSDGYFTRKDSLDVPGLSLRQMSPSPSPGYASDGSDDDWSSSESEPELSRDAPSIAISIHSPRVAHSG